MIKKINHMKIFLYSFLLLFIGVNHCLTAQSPALNVLSLDNRNVNSGPSSYSRELKFEFKSRSIIGVPGTGSFSGLLTLAPWVTDGTGNKHHQVNFNDGGVYYRNGNNNTSTWGAWRSLIIENENGNVGIGTSTPTNKLEVNGTIKTKEVNVTTTGWPDYVFAADYNLMPLDSLSEFIKTNSHLPGVPSESEVNLNGANLGEMNVILLKKIEELTLYIINQDKKIEEIERRINLNQNQNN
jgi:hypothetical protein